MSSTFRMQGLGALAGAAALTLALALGGCGGQAQPEQDSEPQAEEQSTQAEAADDQVDIDVPEIATTSVEAHRSLIEEGDVSGADSYDTLPTRTVDGVEADVDDIAEVTEETSKVPSDHMLLTEGGIQMSIPADWFVSRDDDGFVFTDPTKSLLGYMFSTAKSPGVTYDYEAFLHALPQTELSHGFTAVEIIDDGPLYAANGTQCGYNVVFWESFDGGEWIHYVAFIESKNYLNTVEFMGDPDTYTAQIGNITDALNSILFVETEMA